ncbi:hypothetical protein FRC04_011468 [Tulasnella sp. 424]|nr:hypothetical protein FRC04_011468 [Tulasnella sp. 424]
MFMNTQSSGGEASAQVKGPANTLASASLRFDGELVDHVVGMGPQVSTRLLIFQGEFQRMSVAIYGTPLAGSKLEEPPTQGQTTIPSRSTRLPEAVDPLAIPNPLAIAQALLRRTPDTQVTVAAIIPKCLGHQDQDVRMNGNGVDHSIALEPLPVIEELLQAENPDDELVLEAATELGALLVDAEIDKQISIKDAKVIVAAVALFSVIAWTSDTGDSNTTYQGLLIARLWQMDESIALALYLYQAVVSHAVSALSRVHSSPEPRVRLLAGQILQGIVHHCPAALASVGDSGVPILLGLPQSIGAPEQFDFNTALRLLGSAATSPTLGYGTVLSLRSSIGRLGPVLSDETSEDAVAVLHEAQAVLGQPMVFGLLDVSAKICDTLKERLEHQGSDEPSPQALQNLFGLATETIHLISILRSSVPVTSRAVRQVAILASNLYVASAEVFQRSQGDWQVVETAKDSRDASLSLLEKMYTSAAGQKGLSTSSTFFKPILDGGLHLDDNILKLPSAAEATHDLLLDFVKDAIGESDELRLLTDLMEVTPQLDTFLVALDPTKQASLVARLMDLDNGRSGLGEWLIQHEAETVVGHLHQLAELAGAITEEQTVRAALLRHSVDKHFCYLSFLLETDAKRDVLDYLVGDRQGSSTLEECFRTMLDQDVSSHAMFQVARTLTSSDLAKYRRPSMSITLVFVLLRSLRVQPNPFTASDILPTCLGLLQPKESQDENIFIDANAHLSLEVGHSLAFLSSDDSAKLWGSVSDAAESLTEILDLVIKRHKQGQQREDIEGMEQDATLIGFDGLSEAAFQRLAEITGSAMSTESPSITRFKPELQWSNYQPHQLNPPISWKDEISTSFKTLEGALNPECSRPVTPPQPSTPPTFLGMAALSPFTVLRSPTTKVTSLTKTYSNNDFRNQRTSPNMNTSRPPSMHVDDFQSAPPLLLQPSPMAPWQM